eukprot:Clim_evm2s19 gene=Clim_evmTU2s19
MTDPSPPQRSEHGDQTPALTQEDIERITRNLSQIYEVSKQSAEKLTEMEVSLNKQMPLYRAWHEFLTADAAPTSAVEPGPADS